MKCYVYILFSFSKDKYFIGHAENVLPDISVKNQNDDKNLKGNTDGWLLLHHEVFTTKTEAMAREAQLKKWDNREMLEKLSGFVQRIYNPCDDDS